MRHKYLFALLFLVVGVLIGSYFDLPMRKFQNAAVFTSGVGEDCDKE